MAETKYIWAIGDIHGMSSALLTLHSYLTKYFPESQFIFLGDYIDRGDDSKGVIDLLMRNESSIHLIGNHEQVLLDIISNKINPKLGKKLFFFNGGIKTIQSFGFKDQNDFFNKLETKYIDFLLSLKYSHTIELDNHKIIFIHAGLNKNIPLADQILIKNLESYHEYIKKYNLAYDNTILWVRKEFYESDANLWNNSLIIHGHTPISNLMELYTKPPHINFKNRLNFSKSQFFEFGKLNPNQPFFRLKMGLLNSSVVSINLDTGCGYNNRLTALGINISNITKNKILCNIIQCDLNNKNKIIKSNSFISL